MKLQTFPPMIVLHVNSMSLVKHALRHCVCWAQIEGWNHRVWIKMDAASPLPPVQIQVQVSALILQLQIPTARTQTLEDVFSPEFVSRILSGQLEEVDKSLFTVSEAASLMGAASVSSLSHCVSSLVSSSHSSTARTATCRWSSTAWWAGDEDN